MNYSPSTLPCTTPPSGPLVDWEEVDCPLCDGTHWDPFVEAPDRAPGGSGLWFAVVRCRDCGLCFTNPRPSRENMARFVAPVVFPRRKAARKRRLRLPWDRPAEVQPVLPWHGQGRLLDVGCGNGTFLLRMRREGWQVVGVELSSEVVDRLRTEYALTALTGTIPHPALKPASFDFVSLRQMLQKAYDPFAVL